MPWRGVGSRYHQSSKEDLVVAQWANGFHYDHGNGIYHDLSHPIQI